MLNVDLQGDKKLICNLIQSVSAFRRKLNLFQQDIEHQNFIYFPTILQCKNDSEVIDSKKLFCFISGLVKKFKARFKDFSEIGKLFQFLKTPYDISPGEEWTDVAEK